MAESTTDQRAHQLGDEFRTRATADERQFLNWVAVASAGGITLVLHFLADTDTALRPEPVLLLVPLLAWLVSVLAAGACQYGMLAEQSAAGSMFHAQGRRERQKRKAGGAADGSAEQTEALRLAALFHEEADEHHRVSRRWIEVRAWTLRAAVTLFLIGTLSAVGVLARTVLDR